MLYIIMIVLSAWNFVHINMKPCHYKAFRKFSLIAISVKLHQHFPQEPYLVVRNPTGPFANYIDIDSNWQVTLNLAFVVPNYSFICVAGYYKYLLLMEK